MATSRCDRHPFRWIRRAPPSPAGAGIRFASPTGHAPRSRAVAGGRGVGCRRGGSGGRADRPVRAGPRAACSRRRRRTRWPPPRTATRWSSAVIRCWSSTAPPSVSLLTRQSARSRWQAMRGRSGVLHTGHCLIRCSDGESRSAVTSTTVAFADITDEELEAYLATGEPQRVAGAFTIDGFGGAFVSALEGDPHNVVGRVAAHPARDARRNSASPGPTCGAAARAPAPHARSGRRARASWPRR